MAPSRAAFRARLRDLSPATASEFLTDLYAAQGWSVEGDNGRLSVSRGGTTETVVLADVAADPSDADVVVTRGNASASLVPAGADHLGPEDLYERIRYAVDEPESTRLLTTYFGDLPEETGPARPGPPTDDGETAPEADSDSESGAESGGSRSWSRRALLVAGGAALGAGGVAVAGMDRPRPIEAPGVTAEGVADPSTLAEAHAAATDTQSYTLELDEVRRNANLEMRSAIALDLSLSAEHSYLAVVSTAGPDAPLVLGRPPATSVFWSDGERYYVDHNPGAWTGVSSFRPLRGWVGTWRYWSHVFAFGGRIDSGPEGYFRSLFNAVPVRLAERHGRGTAERYRLVGRADEPATSLENLAGSDHRAFELSAVVDVGGMVRSHDLSYRGRFDGDEGRVRRSVAYTQVGETTVDRPVWTVSVAPDLSTGPPLGDE